MSRPASQVVVLTRHHAFTGIVDLTEQRLSDHLNDDQHTTLRLRDARVARITCPGEPLGQPALALLPKEHILLAYETEAPGQTPKRLYGFVKKNPHPVFMVVDGIEVRGMVHTTSGLDLHDIYRFVASQRERFLPLTRAIVTFCEDENLTMRPEAVIVNMHKLQYIALLPEAPSAPPSAPAAHSTFLNQPAS